MRELLMVWILICGTQANLQGQGVVAGVVRDAGSGEPLAAVNIAVDRKGGTISDPRGEFELRLPPGVHTLEFYYVGYEREKKAVRLGDGDSVMLEVAMSVSSRMLDEVVVTAGKYEQKISEVTVSMELLKPHQLSNQNITSLDMLLEKTSGISILNGQPSIRGGSGFSYGVGSRVLMLVDDLPMISGDAGDIKWSYLPVENVHQVEVIKGASSVLYGSSALNGVINLRTRFPGNDPESEVSVFGGAYFKPQRKELVWKQRAPLFTGGSFAHLRKVGRMELSLGGNLFMNEGYRELEYDEHARGNLALRYRFEKVTGLSAGVSASGMWTNKAEFILWTDADSGAYRQNPDTYAPLSGHRYNIDPYVEYVTPGGDRHSLKTRLYSVGNGTVDETKSSFSKVWYGEYRTLQRLGQSVHWTSGISFMRNTVDAGLYNQHRGSNGAVYTQVDARFRERLKLTGGLRWEVNGLNGEVFYARPVARAGANFQAADATFLRASFGQGYRFPSVAEKFVDASTGGLYIFPNPGLEPEWGWSAETGVKQGFRAGSWSGFADLALFWTEYENMIEYTFGYHPPDTLTRPPAEYVGFKALNIENARILGGELTVSATGSLGPLGMTFTAGYTVMDPVDPRVLRDSGRVESERHVLKYRRRHLIKTDLEIEYRRFFAGANVQYNSRMIRVDVAFSDPLLGNVLMPGFPQYWEDHADGYALVDFRVGWGITPSFRVNAVLRNALNREYLGRPGDLGPPRNLTLQLKFTW